MEAVCAGGATTAIKPSCLARPPCSCRVACSVLTIDVAVQTGHSSRILLFHTHDKHAAKGRHWHPSGLKGASHGRTKP